MVIYTHEASGRGKRVPLTFSTKGGNAPPLPFKGQCPVHGIHSALEFEREDLAIEAQGTTWTPQAEYSASYCEACFSDEQAKKFALGPDATPARVARHVTRDQWRHLKGAFEAAHHEDAGEIAYCPFCGDELADKGVEDDRMRQVVCATHGQIDMTVRQRGGSRL